MAVLALDLGGASWGWACGPAPLRSGTESLPDVGDGRLLAMFHERLWSLIRNFGPDLVACEMPFIHWSRFQPQQIRRWYGLLGVAQMCVHAAGIRPLLEIATSSAKKALTGSGKSTKDDVVNACIAGGHSIGSEDEADAIAVLCAASGHNRMTFWGSAWRAGGEGAE